MIDDKDIVNDIFSRVKEILGSEFKGQVKVRLEKEESMVRKDWGGTRPYVNKKNSRDTIEEIDRMIKRGESIRDISDFVGISREHVYRLLRNRK